jgi:ketosteroid isomerase-like protein
MYQAIVRRKLTTVFTNLGKGKYEGALRDLAPVFTHTFAGDHAFGGTRNSAASFRRWFERLFRVFPDLSFELRTIVVTGWPGDTTAVVEWTDRASTLDGRGYVNEGVHIIRLKWVKVVEFRVYLDTQKIADACRRQAACGILEAVAVPIVD